MKILIIDDDTEVRETIADLIRRIYGEHEILFAADGEKGIELAKKEKPDLISCDLIMPGKNGIEVRVAIGEAGLNSKTIVVSGGGISCWENKAQEAGFDARLQKPFKLVQFAEVFGKFLKAVR